MAGAKKSRKKKEPELLDLIGFNERGDALLISVNPLTDSIESIQERFNAIGAQPPAFLHRRFKTQEQLEEFA
eukprot:g41702.t1